MKYLCFFLYFNLYFTTSLSGTLFCFAFSWLSSIIIIIILNSSLPLCIYYYDNSYFLLLIIIICFPIKLENHIQRLQLLWVGWKRKKVAKSGGGLDIDKISETETWARATTDMGRHPYTITRRSRTRLAQRQLGSWRHRSLIRRRFHAKLVGEVPNPPQLQETAETEEPI